MKKNYLQYKRNIKNLILLFFQRLIFNRLNLVINKGSPKNNLVRLIKLLRPAYNPHKLVRIGDTNDGGYLVPNDINTYDLVISPGVGNTISFDKYFIENKIKVIQIDPFLENSDTKYLKKYSGYLKGYVCEKKNYISLESIFFDLNTNYKKIALQMDIEGAEYEVINSININILNNFSLLIIEFHNMTALLNLNSINYIESAFLKIIDSFFVAHIHVNNTGRIAHYSNLTMPDTLEITFLNRRDYDESKEIKKFKYHELDAACSKQMNEVFLPESWNKIFLNE